jgi:hypothetical protein
MPSFPYHLVKATIWKPELIPAWFSQRPDLMLLVQEAEEVRVSDDGTVVEVLFKSGTGGSATERDGFQKFHKDYNWKRG